MADPAGQIYKYSYDALGNLIEVIYPDGLRRTYAYNEPAYQPTLGYPNYVHYLTGISSEVAPNNFVRYATFTYNGDGLPVSTEHAGGVGKYSLDYSAKAVTDPLGTRRTYAYQMVNGVMLQTSVSQPGGAGCGPAAGNFSYDANGNRASSKDFMGVTTTYAYDMSRNLETSRIEASGTPLARTISTRWHDTLRLPVMVAEPKRITTLTYDAAGNLLTTVEQATADANGASAFAAAPVGSPRTSSYTYNAIGQRLTETGPRVDILDRTSYTYSVEGNLLTVTNAAGQVTTLSNYDIHGHAGRITDPNGIVTDLAYAPRGWLTSRTTSAQGLSETTTYDYDGAGQLKRILAADGSSTNHTYDNAQRLTGIADSLGNSISYTLDAMGNKTAERITDPNGTLARQTTRTYDALNRLQQQTGGVQ